MGTMIETTLPMTPRAERVITAAAVVADEHGATFVGVEHLMLAIVRDRDSVPTQVLERLGVSEAIVREIEEVLASDDYRGGG
jgi:ATP-dependent Clp protease ATP-binding subunit ClpC